MVFVYRLPNFIAVLLIGTPCAAFLASSRFQRPPTTVLFGRAEKIETHFLMQEFTIASGEVVDPYKILKCSRDATRQEIRKSYIELSRRYHPDGLRHRTILPGSCNNVDEVREHWERIKLSYEILSDPKRRRKYDRHESIADPGKAIRRAASNAIWNGAMSAGKGIFSVGAFALNQMNNGKEKPLKEATAE
jgi:DnaJ-class molecular chaperone